MTMLIYSLPIRSLFVLLREGTRRRLFWYFWSYFLFGNVFCYLIFFLFLLLQKRIRHWVDEEVERSCEEIEQGKEYHQSI